MCTPSCNRIAFVTYIPCGVAIFFGYMITNIPVASFTKEINPRLAKRPMIFNGRLANRGLTSLVKEATVFEESNYF